MPCVGDTKSEEKAACIFSELVPVRVKPVGREEHTASLSVRLQLDNVAHPRNLLLELTNESDLLFYHSLMLSEGDFHALKSEQQLLVDFQSFPEQVVELLRRCMNQGATTAAAARTAIGNTGAVALRIAACLDCGSSGDGLLSIVESNQFRELTHISLRMRQGTDDAVKEHLAGKLRIHRADAVDLAERFASSEEQLCQSRREVDELTARMRVVSEERAHLELSMGAAHQRELAELRQEHTQAHTELHQAMGSEREKLEAELRESVRDALVRAERAEKSSEGLQQQVQTLTLSGKACRERLDAAEAQLEEARSDVRTSREGERQLELLKFQHERELGELKVQVASLRERFALQEQLVGNHTAQAEQAGSQRKSLEDSLAASQQQARAFEEKFTLTAKEVVKGNQIIQNLSNNLKQAKAKLRLKATMLAEQEKALLEARRLEDVGKHTVGEKEHELVRCKEKEDQHLQDVDELKRKLAESHEVLKCNQDVIEYLNRQLTERDLRALPPVTSMPSAERSTPLGELLRRAEGIGKSSKGVAIGMGATAMSLGAGLGAGTMGFVPGMYTSPTAFGFSESFGYAGPPDAGRASLSTTTAIVASAAGAADAATLGGRDQLHGPVAYRSPPSASIAGLISVK